MNYFRLISMLFIWAGLTFCYFDWCFSLWSSTKTKAPDSLPLNSFNYDGTGEKVDNDPVDPDFRDCFIEGYRDAVTRMAKDSEQKPLFQNDPVAPKKDGE